MALYDVPPWLHEEHVDAILNNAGISYRALSSLTFNLGQPSTAAWKITGVDALLSNKILHDTVNNVSMVIVSMTEFLSMKQAAYAVRQLNQGQGQGTQSQ